MVAIASAGCLVAPTCLSVDTDALLGLGGNVLCEVAIGGLPGADYIDYCSVVDIDLSGIDLSIGE
ncbi:MAG: hypothetical protein ACXAC5_03650 [Promethearchaeota archaeon]